MRAHAPDDFEIAALRRAREHLQQASKRASARAPAADAPGCRCSYLQMLLREHLLQMLLALREHLLQMLLAAVAPICRCSCESTCCRCSWRAREHLQQCSPAAALPLVCMFEIAALLYIHIYVYTYICIYIYILVSSALQYVCMCIYVCMFLYTCACCSMYVCVYMYVCFLYVCMCAYILYIQYAHSLPTISRLLVSYT